MERKKACFTISCIVLACFLSSALVQGNVDLKTERFQDVKIRGSATVPSVPLYLTATCERDPFLYVFLSWSPPANNGGSAIFWYKIYFGTSSGHETLSFTYANTFVNDTNDAVFAGSTYYYYVTAVNSVGESAPSAEASVYLDTVPNAPTSVSASISGSSIYVSWSSPSNGGSTILHYNVYRGTSSGGETFYNSTTTTGYYDLGITSGTKYYYYVTAVNAVGESSASSEVSATAPSSSTTTSPTILGYPEVFLIPLFLLTTAGIIWLLKKKIRITS